MIGISRASALPRVPAAFQEKLAALLELFEPAARSLPRQFPGVNGLCDLADVLLEVARGERPRASVRIRLGDEPCEIGLERAGEAILVSVYSGGAIPVIHCFERRVNGSELCARLGAELTARLAGAAPREQLRLEATRAALETLEFTAGEGSELSPVMIEAPEELSFALSGELWTRGTSGSSPSTGSVMRTDLLSLLAKGRLRISAFEHTRELGDVHIFLVAEQLVRLTLEAIDAYVAMRPLWRKIQVGGVICGVRVLPGEGGGEPRLALTLGRANAGRSESWTFPSLEVSAFARAVVDFGRALARAVVRSDRSQTHNLRLVEFRGALREVSEACRELSRNDAVVNESPESYRAYARDPRESSGAAAPSGRLRFSPKWTAAVPAIDLRSTFQCGDQFVVGGARELSAIDRNTGKISWTRNVAKGVTVLTPSGLARFDSEGQLTVFDVASGEPKSSLRLAPRVGAPVTGAVVSGPGLPRMLVVSEGRRHLVGIDLEAGEVLWRYASRRAGTFRLRRAGRLVIVASGEQALTALDVVSGQVVWRHCDRLRFAHLPTVAEDSLFALAGDGAFVGLGGTRLCHLDPWSGVARWNVALPEGARPIAAPLVSRSSVLVATLGRRGTHLSGFDRKTGHRLFEREVCVGAAATLIVDDLAILNSESGELCAIDSSDGSLRYRHVFGEGNEGDRPRRLEPVLRSSALFVPQQSVHVVRPSDGCVLGSVSTDLIPDLLRVDERCDVYVAEESGHVAAFSAAARLTLVKST